MRLIFSIIIITFLNFCAGELENETSIFPFKQEINQIYRLPHHVIPKSYSLKFFPDIENENYIGEVTIFVDIQKNTTKVLLHSRYLNITNVVLDQEYNVSYECYTKEELLSIGYSDGTTILPGEHTIYIKFKGVLMPSFGFYKVQSNYKNITHTTLATKFSSIFARLAFPCFDEPFFKATFNLRIVVPNTTYTALSNMEEINSFNTSNGLVVDFKSTKPMSTYLLAFILTDYNYHIFNGKIPIRVYSLPDRKTDRTLKAYFTAKILDFYEKYTGYQYPLSKLDLIEIPNYPSSGMEHWGLVVFQEGALLLPDKNLQHNTGLFMASSYYLLAHELAHMWFGNLVTHQWYNDFWLTEGMARFMQFKAIEKTVPTYYSPIFFSTRKFNLLERCCFNQYYPAMEVIKFDRTADDVRSKYGTLTYTQGGAIMEMLEDIIGPESLKEALRFYFQKYAYKVATTNDFIKIIDSVPANINTRIFLQTWLMQTNLPFISIRYDLDTNNYILKQSPLCNLTDNTNQSSIYGWKWSVPIKYMTSDNKTNFLMFDKDMDKLMIPKNNSTWIKLDTGYRSLFVTKYSDEMYKNLTDNFQNLTNIDKGHLIWETFYLVQLSKINCSIALKMMAKLTKETDPEALYLALHASLDYYYRFGINNNLLRKYIFAIFENHYMRLNWNKNIQNDSGMTGILRNSLIQIFCINLKYPPCFEDVNRILNSNETIDNTILTLFKEVVKMGKNKDETSNETEINNNFLDKNNEEEEPYMDQNSCSQWIKKNIPFYIKNKQFLE